MTTLTRPLAIRPAIPVAITVMSALGLAACSSVDDATTPTSSAVPTSTEQSPTTTTAEPAGSESADWCELARAVDAASSSVDETDFGDPVALERAIGDLLVAAEAAAAEVPEEIADAVATNVAAMTEFRDELVAVDYDFFEADLTVLGDPTGELAAASDRIDRYNADECGIPFDEEDDDDLGFDPSAGSLRDQIVAQFVEIGLTLEQGECLFDRIDFSDPAEANDDDLIEAALVACGVDPNAPLGSG